MICLKIINASLYNNRKLLSPAKNYVSNFFRYRNLTSNRGTFVFKIDGRIDVDRRITIDSTSIRRQFDVLRTKVPQFDVKFRYRKKFDASFLAGFLSGPGPFFLVSYKYQLSVPFRKQTADSHVPGSVAWCD